MPGCAWRQLLPRFWDPTDRPNNGLPSAYAEKTPHPSASKDGAASKSLILPSQSARWADRQILWICRLADTVPGACRPVLTENSPLDCFPGVRTPKGEGKGYGCRSSQKPSPLGKVDFVEIACDFDERRMRSSLPPQTTICIREHASEIHPPNQKHRPFLTQTAFEKDTNLTIICRSQEPLIAIP